MAPENLQEKNLAELRAMAQALGVKNIGKYRKNELIEMLNAETYLTPQQAVEKVNSITKEDVIRCAKKLTLDTVYTLTGIQKEEV